MPENFACSKPKHNDAIVIYSHRTRNGGYLIGQDSRCIKLSSVNVKWMAQHAKNDLVTAYQAICRNSRKNRD